jgi:hypothetical protein
MNTSPSLSNISVYGSDNSLMPSLSSREALNSNAPGMDQIISQIIEQRWVDGVTSSRP